MIFARLLICKEIQPGRDLYSSDKEADRHAVVSQDFYRTQMERELTRIRMNHFNVRFTGNKEEEAKEQAYLEGKGREGNRFTFMYH